MTWIFCIYAPIARITELRQKRPPLYGTFRLSWSLICTRTSLSTRSPITLHLRLFLLPPYHSLFKSFFFTLPTICFTISPSQSPFHCLSLSISHSEICLWHVVEVITQTPSLPHSISLIFPNLPSQSEVRISFSLSLINLSHLPFFHFLLASSFSSSLFLALPPASRVDHLHQLLS